MKKYILWKSKNSITTYIDGKKSRSIPAGKASFHAKDSDWKLSAGRKYKEVTLDRE